jgi:hypothetical protein
MTANVKCCQLPAYAVMRSGCSLGSVISDGVVSEAGDGQDPGEETAASNELVAMMLRAMGIGSLRRVFGA